MFWENRKVLVTGAGGFLGWHLVSKLIFKKANVRAFVRYLSKSGEDEIKQISDDIEIFYGDIGELNTVQQAVEGMDVVFNLAALIGIPYSYIRPLEVVRTNTLGTLNIIQACKEAKVKKIVHISSSEVYGTAQYVPIDEKHPLNPQSPYAASKVAADALAMSYYYSYDLPVVIARSFNMYGPRQSVRAVIPTIIAQALTQKEIKLGSTDSTRDFTYVADTARALLKIAEEEKSVGEVFNIGSGVEYRIDELVGLILTLMDKKLPMVYDPLRARPPASEVKRLCADTSKIKEILGWCPIYPISDGLKMTIGFCRLHLKDEDGLKYAI